MNGPKQLLGLLLFQGLFLSFLSTSVANGHFLLLRDADEQVFKLDGLSSLTHGKFFTIGTSGALFSLYLIRSSFCLRNKHLSDMHCL